MKTIFILGDSITFGFNPIDGSRFDKSTRWTGVLQELLGNDFKIINHGKNNRTFFSKNPSDNEISGIEAIKGRLKDNFDYVMIALGANDCQKAYNAKETDHIKAIEEITTYIKSNSPNAAIILVSPPVIANAVMDTFFDSMFDYNSILKSELLPKLYKEEAKRHGIKYIDFNEITPVSDIDGLHYSIEGHRLIAQKLAEMFTGGQL